MNFREFSATTDDAGRRFDRVIRHFIPAMPLPRIYKSIRAGMIRLNGKKAAPESPVAEKDRILIAEPVFAEFFADSEQNPAGSPGLPRIAGSDVLKPRAHTIELTDIFRNSHIRVINKPYGIPVHAAGNGKNAVPAENIAAIVRDETPSDSLSFRCGPLHRLDRQTTGVLAVSQSLKGARWFSEALAAHQIGKSYLALLQGSVEKDLVLTGTIEKKLPDAGRRSGQFVTVTVSGSGAAGKNAETCISPLAHGSFRDSRHSGVSAPLPVTLVSVSISTGRQHQIRAQCAAAGHPLLGDTAYGGISAAVNGQSLFLHAFRLAVPAGNPLGLPAVIEAPVPENFTLMMKKCLIEFDIAFYTIGHK